MKINKEYIIRLLSRPFPIIDSRKEKIIIGVTVGIFIFLFLAVFQPFGFYEVEKFKLPISLGFGIITSGVILFNFFITMRMFNEYFSAVTWNVGKSITLSMIMIFSIAIFNWLYAIALTNYLPQKNIHHFHESFLKMFFETLAVGIFPILFLIFFSEKKLRKVNVEYSEKINEELKSKQISQSHENIIINSNNETIYVNPEKFLCINSMGNYIVLHQSNNGSVKKDILRATMATIEKENYEHQNIFRCHKSYIINPDKIISSNGNARSLNLNLEDLDFQVPVSRKISKNLFEKLQHN